MRTILHLSDLHFGRIDEPLLEPLLAAAGAARPDLVVVSGDLTQRARRRQFIAARAFLDALPLPRLVVPGNHDVPMHNPVARFAAPLQGYRRYISEDPEPSYFDDQVAVLGLSSARSLTVAQGRLSERQVTRMLRVFGEAPAGVVKVLVSHHPFDLPPGFEDRSVVQGASRVVEAMALSGGDVVLSGHFHTGHTSTSAVRYGRSAGGTQRGRAILLVHAGTATSTRRRGQESSFNLLRVEGPVIDIEEHRWDKGRGTFTTARTTRFRKGDQGWLPEGGA